MAVTFQMGLHLKWLIEYIEEESPIAKSERPYISIQNHISLFVTMIYIVGLLICVLYIDPYKIFDRQVNVNLRYADSLVFNVFIDQINQRYQYLVDHSAYSAAIYIYVLDSAPIFVLLSTATWFLPYYIIIVRKKRAQKLQWGAIFIVPFGILFSAFGIWVSLFSSLDDSSSMRRFFLFPYSVFTYTMCLSMFSGVLYVLTVACIKLINRPT